jgi:hypothetical protein
MRSIAIIGALALAASPLAAQGGKFRTDVPTTGTGSVLGSVLGQGQEQQQQGRTNRKSEHIPPGQMPPAGMCRIWIDGVPPGQQPAPTDCQTAVATKPANARVIFGGEGTTFPGKANGKFDKSGKGKGHDDDRDDLDDDRGRNHGKDREIRDRRQGTGVLGSVIPTTANQKSVGQKSAASKHKGKGRG